MNKGELLLNNIKGNFLKSDGFGIGMIEPDARMPALPCDAPEAGPYLSIMITRCPDLWSQIAEETPTMPAPTIKISFIMAPFKEYWLF